MRRAVVLPRRRLTSPLARPQGASRDAFGGAPVVAFSSGSGMRRVTSLRRPKLLPGIRLTGSNRGLARRLKTARV
jgi:hypothetical protein